MEKLECDASNDDGKKREAQHKDTCEIYQGGSRNVKRWKIGTECPVQ